MQILANNTGGINSLTCYDNFCLIRSQTEFRRQFQRQKFQQLIQFLMQYHYQLNQVIQRSQQILPFSLFHHQCWHAMVCCNTKS